MKILAIRGKNLASLEGEFEIDFTTEPLRSAGIFAITGQTGAGKSTILDALCLALFDDAPRLNKAESSINVNDVEDKTITQKDSRNILRRGTSEGYAEVDFIALNGDKYRSRWMVRRARGKSAGALQPTSIKVDNLSTGAEEQGTKTDLLNRIKEIIGLTFDQFTRAVLLAQGDFANFLKAKQNEKAELLEKLTGTDVYSRISVAIYQKTGEAKIALDLLQQRIKDVKLLTDEELDALSKEKSNLEKETEPLKHLTSVIEKKLNWIKQEAQFKGEIAQAENDLNTVREQIRQAASRYEYISMVDISQEIRDAYIDLQNKRAQQEKLSISIQSKEVELVSISEKFVKIDSELKSTKDILEEADQKYNNLKPQIAEAKELDMKIQSFSEKLNETNKDLSIYKKQFTDCSQNIQILKKQESETKQRIEILSKWFQENDNYKDVVPRIDLLTSLITNAQSAKKQKANAASGLESSKAIFVTYNNQLKQQEEEAERLEKLLPSEILNLRNKLEEGKPCLVCGSIHHPLQEIVTQSSHVDEKELEAAKKSIVDSITKTKENIDKTQKGITEFEIHIKNFETQYENSFNDLKQYLSNVTDWENKLNSDVLHNELTAISIHWNENKQQLDNSSQQLANYTVRLEAEAKSLDTINTNLEQKEEAYKQLNSSLTEYVEQRKQLLGNRSVEEIEERYTKFKEQSTRKYEDLRNEKEKIEKEKATAQGTINQIKKDCESIVEQIAKLNTEVHNWLNNNPQISLELLHDIVSKSREWINQERNYLNGLKNQELINKATLTERDTKLKKHQESEDKPDEDQNNDTLSLQLQEISIQSQTINNRLTEINVALLAHTKGKEQIKTFENELNQKSELYNNWAKLNDLLGSATGNKFKTIAQGYTLDVLLGYANKHLEELTRRYKLEKIPDTLALQVIDNDMLGEVRTVHSLSGGESFLISLALALGLSSLSSNRMKIESLFIDEGFGALDIDTLSIAMDALDNLQTQGRKIGVISHVEEMKERITTQIQVVKSANGRSVIKIVG